MASARQSLLRRHASSPSNVKCVLNQSDRHVLRTDAIDGNHIEAAPALEASGPGKIVERHGSNPPPLPERNCFGGGPVALRSARLDLDKHDHAVVARHDVNFSKACPVSSGKNCVPATLELAASEIFACVSEALPVERRRHAHRTRFREIDIVSDDRGVVVFVEVKARKSNRLGGASRPPGSTTAASSQSRSKSSGPVGGRTSVASCAMSSTAWRWKSAAEDSTAAAASTSVVANSRRGLAGQTFPAGSKVLDQRSERGVIGCRRTAGSKRGHDAGSSPLAAHHQRRCVPSQFRRRDGPRRAHGVASTSTRAARESRATETRGMVTATSCHPSARARRAAGSEAGSCAGSPHRSCRRSRQRCAP